MRRSDRGAGAAPAAASRKRRTGSPGTPPAGNKTGCQELARKEATSGLPRSADPGLRRRDEAPRGERVPLNAPNASRKQVAQTAQACLRGVETGSRLSALHPPQRKSDLSDLRNGKTGEGPARVRKANPHAHASREGKRLFENRIEARRETPAFSRRSPETCREKRTHRPKRA